MCSGTDSWCSFAFVRKCPCLPELGVSAFKTGKFKKSYERSQKFLELPVKDSRQRKGKKGGKVVGVNYLLVFLISLISSFFFIFLFNVKGDLVVSLVQMLCEAMCRLFINPVVVSDFSVFYSKNEKCCV